MHTQCVASPHGVDPESKERAHAEAHLALTSPSEPSGASTNFTHSPGSPGAHSNASTPPSTVFSFFTDHSFDSYSDDDDDQALEETEGRATSVQSPAMPGAVAGGTSTEPRPAAVSVSQGPTLQDAEAVQADLESDDVNRVLEEYYGFHLTWATSPVAAKMKKENVDTQAAVATQAPTTAGRAATPASSPTRQEQTSPKRQQPPRAADAVPCAASSVTQASPMPKVPPVGRARAQSAIQSRTAPAVYMRAGDRLKGSCDSPSSRLWPPRRPPSPTSATAAKSPPLQPPSSPLITTVASVMTADAMSTGPPQFSLTEFAPTVASGTVDGAVSTSASSSGMRVTAAHDQSTKTDVSGIAHLDSKPPAAARRDLSCTPAAKPLRVCRIPPIAPLDAPSRSDGGSSGGVHHSSSSRDTDAQQREGLPAVLLSSSGNGSRPRSSSASMDQSTPKRWPMDEEEKALRGVDQMGSGPDKSTQPVGATPPLTAPTIDRVRSEGNASLNTSCTSSADTPSVKRGSRLNSAFANVGSGALAQGASSHTGTTRVVRVRRVSFKEGDMVALPDSTSLRTPMTPFLIFRNPTIREQGKEMMPPPSEVFAQLLQRGTAVCSLAVVDEDAMRRPCIVASGCCVRVYEEDRALALGKGRAVHGAMKVLHSFRTRLRGGGPPGSRDSDSVGSRLSAAASSSESATKTNAPAGNGGSISSGGSIVMMPDRRDRRGTSGEEVSESHGSDFDKFLHRIVFDEALSRPKGENVCESVTLQLLARRWELGQNTSLVLGNGSGRSVQCYDLVIGVVRDAMAQLRERLCDPASTAELQMHMGDVFTDEATGLVRVQDMLVCDTDSESDTSTSDSDAAPRDAAPTTTTTSSADRQQRMFPSIRLARSPLMGTYVKGLSVATAEDALSDPSNIFRALGHGFHRYNVSTHSSRSGSFSSVPSAGNVTVRGAHTCFAVLRLRTLCRGKDMRSAPLSSREATSVGEERVPKKTKKSKTKGKGASTPDVTHRRTTECAADVVVSTLLITFFGTEYQVLKTVVENKLIEAKQARGGAYVVAAEQLHYSPREWTDPVHFLFSIMGDALGGRTHTVTCLCLSEYDAHATPWLHVMERTRSIVNAEPNSGNLRTYLHYLLEQYESLDAQQRRVKKGLGARQSIIRKDGTASPAAAAGPVGDACPGEVSMYFVLKLVHSLDRYLAEPVGEPPLLERLEVKSAEVLPLVHRSSLPILTAIKA